jgi:hypothetical protein
MALIKKEDIREINRLYLELKTYAAVARATGFSPATVKKYIIPGFTLVEEDQKKKFSGELKPFDPSIFRCNDWDTLCVLSEDEILEITELWKELES